MGWFKNAVGKASDFIGDLFAPSKSNNEQHVGWNINLPIKTYTYDNSNESPLTKANDPLYKIQQDIADAAVAAAYGITIPKVPTTTPTTTVTTGGSADDFTVSGEKEEKEKKQSDIAAIIAAIKEGMVGASGYAKSQYENQLAAIEEQRKYSEELAKQAREEAIKKAYVNYDRSLSTYGQNAEKLAQMGLSNSGYSDYLNGVAYSSMVGGVQDAHKTENEAIERAYYNASQAKAEAADTYYDRATAAQNAYQDRIVSLLGAIGTGEIDANTAMTIAAAYGMDESVASMIGDVAKTNYENVVAENTALLEASLAGEDDEYGGKTFASDEAIKAAANKIGITDESVIQGYIDTKNKNENEYKDKKTYDLALSQITAETTDEEIEGWGLSTENTDKLKAERNNKIVSDEKQKIATETASGNVSLGNIEAIDILYQNEKITKDVYQKIYFDKAVSFAKGIENLDEYQTAIEQINGYVNQDKMTNENAQKVKEYIASVYATVVPENSYILEKAYLLDARCIYGKTYVLEVNGETYSVMDAREKNVEDDTVKKLIDIVLGNQKELGFVMIGDAIYIRTGETKYSYRKMKDYHDTTKVLRNLALTSARTPIKPSYTPSKEQ